MPLLGALPVIEERSIPPHLPDASPWHRKIGGGFLPEEFTLLAEHASPGEAAVSSLSGEIIVARTRPLRPPMFHHYHFDVVLAGDVIEQFPQPAAKGLVRQGEPASPTLSSLSTNVRSTTVTPAAEKYARSLGLYGALVLTKGLVRETIPVMKALTVDKKMDPDDGGYSTICFTITIPESVDRALELDDALQDVLYDRLPSDALFYFTFTYRFE